MASAVQGKSCVFQINITGGWKTVLCAKSFSINIVTEEVEITTISDGSDPEEGYWRDYDYQSLSYTVTFDGILKNVDSTDDTIWEVLSAQTQFLEVPFRIVYTDPESNAKTASGTVLVKNISISASSSALVQTVAEFTGKGKLNIS